MGMAVIQTLTASSSVRRRLPKKSEKPKKSDFVEIQCKEPFCRFNLDKLRAGGRCSRPGKCDDQFTKHTKKRCSGCGQLQTSKAKCPKYKKHKWVNQCKNGHRWYPLPKDFKKTVKKCECKGTGQVKVQAGDFGWHTTDDGNYIAVKVTLASALKNEISVYPIAAAYNIYILSIAGVDFHKSKNAQAACSAVISRNETLEANDRWPLEANDRWLNRKK
jgi:hypothetical protein